MKLIIHHSLQTVQHSFIQLHWITQSISTLSKEQTDPEKCDIWPLTHTDWRSLHSLSCQVFYCSFFPSTECDAESLTQAIFSKCQNSLCLLICICITVLSASLMLSRVFSIRGNKSMIFCLLIRILLSGREETGQTLTHSVRIVGLPCVCAFILENTLLITDTNKTKRERVLDSYLRCVYRSLRTLSWFWTVWMMAFTISELSLLTSGSGTDR